ncbi:nucleotide disphospho-sugar-binding domain-containing protein [Enterovirga aerilata]|uniref:Glycosyltransferase family 1 protein n=1 Tax=Enterovirga aerilata TaxID=2730920 RepID=A0A849HYT9_9HYPH|nr:glycosyltransferase family 1 protein [Enterovirga sp. DB1703]
MAALARDIAARGHRSTFLHIGDAEPLLRESGLAFRVVGQGSHPPGSLAGAVRRMGAVNGPIGLGGIIRDVAAITDMLCRDLPSALREIGTDCLVCDQTEAAGGLVARHLGMPFVSVANALPLNREPGIPPPFTPWRYDASRWGVERNLGGYRVSDILMRPVSSVIRHYATLWSLDPLRTIEDCASPLAQVAQLVPGLDFPRQALPETFHYCGPFRDEETVPRDFSMPGRDGRPLVYLSLGTLQGGRARLFRVLSGAAHRAGTQPILSHAGRLSAEDAARLPGRPAAFAWVPQRRVMAEAELALFNGGQNTMLDAAAAGIPVVVIPIAFEQAAIGARIAWAGAGRTVSRRFLTAGRLAGIIRHILNEPSYRMAAQRLRAEIGQAGGVRLAARIVERVAATGAPVTTSDVRRSPDLAVPGDVA